MDRKAIPFDKLQIRPQDIFNRQGMILTSGDFTTRHFNAMTIGWGSLGVMWRRPFVQVVVRPVRYTYEFMEKYPTFTVCAFSDDYAKAVELLGNKSGREGDKIAEAGLTPIASTRVAAPGFAQAELILECNKMYWQDMDSKHFLDPTLHERYPKHDYHRIYYGEIVAAFGTPVYSA